MRARLLSGLLQTRKLLCNGLRPRLNGTVTYCQLAQAKCFSTNNKKTSSDEKNEEKESANLTGAVGTKHKIFREDDAEIIFDVDEEQDRVVLDELIQEEEDPDLYQGLNLERGVNGVFEIEDLVAVLRRENAKQIFVVRVPPSYAYVDYIVVVTAISSKHIHALAAFVRKVYKLKRRENDVVPRLEGKNSKDWAALDLGNIALHIFLRNTRIEYDLETLWAVGPEFDDKINKRDEPTVMDQYNAILADLEPAEVEEDAKKL